MCLLTFADDLGKLMTNIHNKIFTRISGANETWFITLKRIVKWWYFFHSGMMGIRSIVCTKVLWHFLGDMICVMSQKL